MEHQHEQQQQQQIYHPNTLKIVINDNGELFTTSCSRFGTQGQWEYTVTTVFNNATTLPLPRSMNEVRSINATNECAKTCQQFYNNPKQKQHYKPKTFQIKVDCNRKIGKTTCSRYDAVGKWQCTVTTVCANATKQLLTGRQIGQSSIKAMYDCTKKYYQHVLKNNENLSKQVRLEKVIRRIKATK